MNDYQLTVNTYTTSGRTIGVRLQLNHFSKDCENAVSGTFTDKIFSSPIDTGASSS